MFSEIGGRRRSKPAGGNGNSLGRPGVVLGAWTTGLGVERPKRYTTGNSVRYMINECALFVFFWKLAKLAAAVMAFSRQAGGVGRGDLAFTASPATGGQSALRAGWRTFCIQY